MSKHEETQNDVATLPQVLILLATMFLFSGSSGLPGHVDDVIDSKRRSKIAVAAAEQTQKELESLTRHTLESRAQLYAVLAEKPLDRARFEAVLAPFDARVIRKQQRLLDLRFEMRDAMTPKEWAKLFKELDEDK